MVAMLLLLALGIAEILTYKGVDIITRSWTHTIIGMFVTCAAPAVSALGAICIYF